MTDVRKLERLRGQSRGALPFMAMFAVLQTARAWLGLDGWGWAAAFWTFTAMEALSWWCTALSIRDFDAAERRRRLDAHAEDIDCGCYGPGPCRFDAAPASRQEER